MKPVQSPRGVLDHTYARDRQKKPELMFRLRTRAAVVAEAARLHLGTNSRLEVLDMGCAEGRTLSELSRHLPQSRFIGVELSTGLVEAACELPENITVIQGDITRLPGNIKADSFDLVCALAVLEHLASPLTAVREAARVLKPGGLFVASSPRPGWDRVSVKLGLLKGDTHECEVDRSLIVSVVHDGELDVCEFRRFMWAPVSFLPYLHIPVSPAFALRTDRVVERLKVLNWMFVNQAVIARKPK